ncbi:hypothetical protein VNO77_06215 [Canavalia gladiata]|uniref:Uncharacterized protein n=1 Tax=Canavalia gladiata TaxID=3824 RepID=A0AAN9QZY3_CANGL
MHDMPCVPLSILPSDLSMIAKPRDIRVRNVGNNMVVIELDTWVVNGKVLWLVNQNRGRKKDSSKENIKGLVVCYQLEKASYKKEVTKGVLAHMAGF